MVVTTHLDLNTVVMRLFRMQGVFKPLRLKVILAGNEILLHYFTCIHNRGGRYTGRQNETVEICQTLEILDYRFCRGYTLMWCCWDTWSQKNVTFECDFNHCSLKTSDFKTLNRNQQRKIINFAICAAFLRDCFRALSERHACEDSANRAQEYWTLELYLLLYA